MGIGTIVDKMGKRATANHSEGKVYNCTLYTEHTVNFNV